MVNCSLQGWNLLILDEPTNHLDMETLQWLEQYLKNYDGAILIVSHDRYFLDQIVTQVYELSRTKIKNMSETIQATYNNVLNNLNNN